MRLTHAIAAGLLSLASTPASADAPAQAILWKGSRNKAEAEARKATGSTLEAFLRKAGLSLPEGYPRLIESKTLPGLKPGFWVWLLGLCEPEAAPSILGPIKRLAPETYARAVRIPTEQLSCPQQEGAPLEARKLTLKRPSGATLRVFTRDETTTPDPEHPNLRLTRTRYFFTLIGANGAVLDSKDLPGDERFNGAPAPGFESPRCDVTRLSATGKDTLSFIRHCTTATTECGALASLDERTVVTVEGDTVVPGVTERANEEDLTCH
ncbi:hypothetical protein D7W79_21950 [Corallococcus exercitus]|uniref:hypothetical protein n=1 Tax=Corallococcus exercitus TaxID=2316736 RepID=UPI000EA0AC21|nr:hypothetical protein [Corallococcus exercitus]RKG74802.1 hypothetical protein D7W79_21950 [Corallococcus exercitus]